MHEYFIFVRKYNNLIIIIKRNCNELEIQNSYKKFIIIKIVKNKYGE